MLLIMVGDWPMRRHDHSFVILATRCRISRSDTTVIVVPIQWYPTTGTHSIEREVVFSTSNAQNRVLLLSLLLLSLSTEHRGSCIHAQVYAQCTFLSFVYVCLCVRVFLSRSLFFSTIVCVFPMKKNITRDTITRRAVGGWCALVERPIRDCKKCCALLVLKPTKAHHVKRTTRHYHDKVLPSTRFQALRNFFLAWQSRIQS